MTEDPTADTVRVPWRSRSLQAILASTAILPLGAPMLSPILPAIRDHFGIGDPGASLVMVVYFLPAVVLSPFIGMLIDRAGRRRVLLGMLVLWSVMGVTIAFQPSFTVVLLMRFLQGAAAAGVFIVTVTLIGDLYEGVQRNAVIGMNGATLFAAAAIAPLLGGLLVAYGWNVPFSLFIVGIPVAVFILYAIAEPVRDPPQTGLGYMRGAAVALPTGPALGLYGSAILVELATFGAILTAMPFVLVDDFGTSPVVVGAVITANLLVTATVSANNGRFAARMSEGQLIALGFIAVGIGLLVAWIAGGPIEFAVAAMIVGSGYGLVFPSVDASITSIAPASYRGGALSLRNSATFLGRGTGPLLVALAATTVGYRPVLAVSGAVILSVGTGAIVLTRR